MKRLIRSAAPDAYAEGLREGGIIPPEFDEEDTQAVKDWISSQLPFVNGFAGDVVAAAGDADAKRAILARIDMWVAALEALAAIALANARKNAMGTWKLGPTEHCKTCAWLSEQRHRLKWFLRYGYIPREVGS